VSASGHTLLPDGVETSFAEIESTMARLASGEGRHVTAARSLVSTATGTVVAIGPCDRLVDAAAALKEHAETGGIRAILIATGDRPTADVRVTASEISLEGLRPRFINNAVAALRLPSLPMLVWWRGGDPPHAERVARLADRLVLDAEDPAALWARVETLIREAAVSDLRWTALTRWRALMAHFFDLPGVPAAAARFTRLHISGSDVSTVRLFAGWLAASLKWRQGPIQIEHRSGPPLETVVFGNGAAELSLRRLPGSQCIEGRARLDHREGSRISSLGNHTLTTLIAEELRVRSRDTAFEAAVRAAGAIS
jgi:glucose-6-phosphate dehydrogenase assembly protein OpcA